MVLILSYLILTTTCRVVSNYCPPFREDEENEVQRKVSVFFRAYCQFRSKGLNAGEFRSGAALWPSKLLPRHSCAELSQLCRGAWWALPGGWGLPSDSQPDAERSRDLRQAACSDPRNSPAPAP